MNKYEVMWLLDKIKFLETKTHPSWLPTHRNIWQGSYDVISCPQDEIDQIEIPKRRMKEAEESGFIKSDTGPENKLMYSWDKNEHHLELEFIPNQPAEFFYRNRNTEELYDVDWIVGEEPLDKTIIEKIELFKG